MVFIPMNDATKVPVVGALNVYFPSLSVMEPMLVPFTEIVTASIFSPFADEVTVPLTVRFCENALSEVTNTKKNKASVFFIKLILKFKKCKDVFSHILIFYIIQKQLFTSSITSLSSATPGFPM
jgi:hypothetical protein